MLGSGLSMASGLLTRVLGSGLLHDLQAFVTALDTVFGGFRERAEQTARLLAAPGTLFLVVATPQPDALREAAFFTERLTDENMPLAGLVLARLHTSGAMELSPERALAAAEELEERGEHPLGAAVLRLHAGRMRLIEREQHLAERFFTVHPRTPVVTVSARPEDVHDVPTLADVAAELTRPPGTPLTGLGRSDTPRRGRATV
jgi:anion-transporting  ArsA/GET3 family ATPase